MKIKAMKKDAYYFKHDSNARNDEKLLNVRRNHGMEGYGVYWAIVEKLRESKNYTLTDDYDSIAWDLRVEEGLVKSIIEKYGLFVIEDGMIRSPRLCVDMEEWDNKKEARRQAGIIGMKARWSGKEKEEEVVVEKEKTPKKAKAKKYTEEETRIHSECKKIFSDLYLKYTDTDFYWQAKEMTAIVNIVKQIKFKMDENDKEDTSLVVKNFKVFVQAIFTNGEEWYKANISPTLIHEKFNEIYTKLKNKTSNGDKQSTSTGNARDNIEYLTTIASNLRGSGTK